MTEILISEFRVFIYYMHTQQCIIQLCTFVVLVFFFFYRNIWFCFHKHHKFRKYICLVIFGDISQIRSLKADVKREHDISGNCRGDILLKLDLMRCIR